MEQMEQELIQLFEEMKGQVKLFRRKTYSGTFETGHQKYQQVMQNIETMCDQASEEEKGPLMEQLASIIPEHAKNETQNLSKGKRERDGIDYNMTMAVYVVPLFLYKKGEYCTKIAERMVEVWNAMDVTGLTLSKSSYEDIAGGFRKGLCYITTAVCKNQKKADDCYELELLRGYRDEYLLKTHEGQKLVEEYYEIAPGIVRIIEMQKNAEVLYGEIYQYFLLACIHCIEEGKLEECKEHYVNMVQHLQAKYLYS